MTMAWNEPGKDRDPWGKQDDQSPPDLDEAFRKLQNNLTGVFGGGSSGGGSGGVGGRLTKRVLSLIGIVLILLYFALGVYQVDQQERGVILRLGKLVPEVVLPGLHWNPPFIDRRLIENVTAVRSRPHDSEMLTEDENIVKVKMTVQYVISDIIKYKLLVKEPDQSMYQAMESALRHVVGSTEMHEVLTEGRAQLAIDVRDRIQDYMNQYGTGIQITQVNIDETAPPDAVRAAFDDVIKAREDEVRLKNEADAYANQVIPEARGEAQRYLEEAQGYKEGKIAQAGGEAERFNKLYVEYELAPEVTRERMYIDTLESVMSNSTKVLIDVEEGNNIFYLPLDRIMQQSQSTGGSFTAPSDRTTSTSGSTSTMTNNRQDRR